MIRTLLSLSLKMEPKEQSERVQSLVLQNQQ